MTDRDVVSKIEHRYADIRLVKTGRGGEAGGLRVNEDHITKANFSEPDDDILDV